MIDYKHELINSQQLSPAKKKKKSKNKTKQKKSDQETEKQIKVYIINIMSQCKNAANEKRNTKIKYI